MGDGGSSMSDRTPDMSGRTEQAKQAVGDAPRRARERTEGNPLAAGMIAFGLGALVGSALPETDAERRVAREATEHVDVEGTRERMSDRAQDVKETVQERGREAADDLKGTAKGAAQDVKERGREEGQRVGQEAQQSGQQVRRQS